MSDTRAVPGVGVDEPPAWWGPVGPVLGGVVPVLMLWGDNVVDVPVRDGLVLACVLGAAGLLLWLVLRFLVRLGRARASITTTTTLLTFSFMGALPIGPVWQLVSLGVVVVGSMVLVARLSAAGQRRLGAVLLAVLGALAVANTFVIALGQPDATGAEVELSPVEVDRPVSSEDLRDVWVIVPDRYPGSQTLARRGLDGTGFHDDLEARGFTVLDDATANYPETLLSLASAWNLELFDADGAEGSAIKRQAVPAIDRHAFGEQLTRAGYRYTHLGPWSDFTAAPSVADRVLTLDSNSELTEAWTSRSALAPALSLTGLTFDVDGRHRRHAAHELASLDQLALADAGPPELVMAHVILPHEPYVFGPDGGPRRATDDVAAYDHQRRYLDDRLLGIVDALQERDQPPIIVIAADEGLYPAGWDWRQGAQFDWSQISGDEARDKLSILAAVYDPDPASDNPIELTDATSLVNVMRWTLNEAVGAGLDALPDDHFLYTDLGGSTLSRVELEGP